jgi:hypothetical protein
LQFVERLIKWAGGEIMNQVPTVSRQALSVVCALLLFLFPGGAVAMAQDAPQQPQQEAPPPGTPPAGPAWSPDQLANLVAPIALYPDQLLSQILVASTYPLELVEAQQWLQQNRNLQGQQLVDAARQQNWDPSIQALVVFPDVITRLTSNVQWTTDLGNAFLAQQADVMAAVQRLRREAMDSGRLRSGPQESVTTQDQNGQQAIVIQPSDPQVIYVPQYNPEYVWGPPVYGYYPPLWYPAVGFGFGWGPGIFCGGFFGGWGWPAWGWGFNWFGGGIFLNVGFFNHFGFHGYGYGHGYGGFGRGGFGRAAWTHDPAHRMGVPYANRTVANRFGGNFASRGAGAARSGFAGSRAFSGTASGTARSGFGGARAGSGFTSRGNAAQGAARSGGSGGWNHFGGTQPANRGGSAFAGSGHSAQAYRSAPSSGGNAYRSAPSYRSPSYGGNYGARNTPAYRSNPGFNGAYRSAPSYHGSAGGGSHGWSGGGGYHSSAPHASAPHASGGGGFHGGGGGGGSHGGGGGGSHGGRR